MGINFITDNTAVDAFRKGMKDAQDARMADVKLLQENLGLIEGTASAPGRIKRVTADARTATANADVAEQVVPYEVQIRKNTAERGGIETGAARLGLTEQQQTSAPRVAAQNAGYGETVATSAPRVAAQTATYRATAEEAPLGTEQKKSDVQERVVTSPYRVQQTQQATRIGAVNAEQAELTNFKESLSLIASGRIAEGKELAKRGGSDLPDDLVNNTALMGQLKDISDEAERRYPNRPKAQLDYIKEASKQLVATPGGNAVAPQTQRFNVPGAPVPQEVGAAKNAPALQQNVDFLIQRGVAKDTAEAMTLLNQSKTDPSGVLNKMVKDETDLRIEEAKAKGGGFGTYDLDKIQREADQAATRKYAALKATVKALETNGVAIPPGAASAAAAAVPPAPPAPAPAPPAPDPWWKPSWLKGAASSGVPVPEKVVAPAAPAAPAVPKVQDRLAVPPLDPALQQRAQSLGPDEVRKQAAAAIAAGKDRDAVISRLKGMGIDTTGL